MEKKDLNNATSAGGMPPALKSRSKKPPAAKAYHRKRLNDAVTLAPKWKHPNAQKHAVFALNPTIPGEDVREYLQLCTALIDEWQASGATEKQSHCYRQRAKKETNLLLSTRRPSRIGRRPDLWDGHTADPVVQSCGMIKIGRWPKKLGLFQRNG
jgi:hypothetical protein